MPDSREHPLPTRPVVWDFRLRRMRNGRWAIEKASSSWVKWGTADTLEEARRELVDNYVENPRRRALVRIAGIRHGARVFEGPTFCRLCGYSHFFDCDQAMQPSPLRDGATVNDVFKDVRS